MTELPGIPAPPYTARYRRDADGWVVEIAEQPRVHSCGDSLAEARRMIRDALATWLDVPAEALPPVQDVVELPRHLAADEEALSRLEGLLLPHPTA